MKVLTSAFFIMVLAIQLQAQDYQVTFAGTGAAITVDSVKVENLTQCTSLAITGTDTLVLSSTAGITEPGPAPGRGVVVYPNPSTGNFSVIIEAASAGIVVATMFDMSGKIIGRRTYLITAESHSFLLDAMPAGSYILEVRSDSRVYHAKLISQATTTCLPGQVHPGPLNVFMKNNPVSGSKIFMLFSAGDTLKLTGRSGNLRTVSMLFPTQSQTVTFTFMHFADADSNHYAVVKIGSQWWMQENMKATHYRDGSPIPNVTDSATWGSLTTGAYCDYHNLPEEGLYYGHLYNFYAAADSRNLCPAGWHVPTHSEWNIMEKLLDHTVDTLALGGTGKLIGRMLKEGCSTRWQYMDTTSGINSAGFTALCTNYRNASGAWSLAPGNNHDDGFWTATPYSTSSAWFRSLRWCYADIYSLFPMKRSGYSVRCIRDN